MDCVFGIVSEKESSSSFRFSPMLPHWNFMVLCFTFRSVSFRASFCEGYKVYDRFIVFACGHPVVATLYIEETIFAPLYCLCSPVENLLTIHAVLGWTRYLFPLVYLSFTNTTLS